MWAKWRGVRSRVGSLQAKALLLIVDLELCSTWTRPVQIRRCKSFSIVRFTINHLWLEKCFISLAVEGRNQPD